MTKVTLTKANASKVSTISNINNPEWGVKSFQYNAEGFSTFGKGANSAHLFDHEFKFWQIESCK